MSEQTTDKQQGPRDRPFNPWRTAESPAAKALVAEVRERLVQHEPKVFPRERTRRATDWETFDKQVEALVADITYEYLAHPQRWVSTTLSKRILGNQGRYGSRVLSKTYPRVVKLLCSPELAIVDILGGSKFDWEGDGIKQTSLHADKALIELIERHGVRAHHFRIRNTGEVIILRSARENIFEDKTSLQYTDTPQTIQYREQVHQINQWLDDADIDFDASESDQYFDARDRHLVRIFNNGSFDQGGRLFGGFWQAMPRYLRSRGILINGNRTVTLDFGQIAPRIMYGMARAQPQFEDAYMVEPFGLKYRDGVKKVFNTLLCAAKRPTRFPQGVRDLIPEQSIKVNQIIDAILEHHQPIAHLFYSNHGLKVMHQESQIMVSILLELIEQEIVGLPIHDALIVEEHLQEEATQLMKDTFRSHTGLPIPVTVDDD